MSVVGSSTTMRARMLAFFTCAWETAQASAALDSGDPSIPTRMCSMPRGCQRPAPGRRAKRLDRTDVLHSDLRHYLPPPRPGIFVSGRTEGGAMTDSTEAASTSDEKTPIEEL